MPAPSNPEKFWAKTRRTSSGCLEYTGYLQKHGYGYLSYRGQLWLSHRLAWTLSYGEIPQGSCVCHTCDNPCCVEPEHLFIGTHADNMGDMKKKGRRKAINSGANNGRAKLSPDDAEEIRRCYGANESTQVQLAARYGVSQTLVSMIVRGVHWRHR